MMILIRKYTETILKDESLKKSYIIDTGEAIELDNVMGTLIIDIIYTSFLDVQKLDTKLMYARTNYNDTWNGLKSRKNIEKFKDINLIEFSNYKIDIKELMGGNIDYESKGYVIKKIKKNEKNKMINRFQCLQSPVPCIWNEYYSDKKVMQLIDKLFFDSELNFEGHCVEFYEKNRFVQFLLRPKVAKRGQNRSKKGLFRFPFFSRPKFDIISTQWP